MRKSRHCPPWARRRGVGTALLEVARRTGIRIAGPNSEGLFNAVDGISFDVRPGAIVFHTVLIHMENGVPIQYEDRYVNPSAAPEYLDTDFNQTSPTLHLLRHAPLTEASYSIEACLPSALEAKELAIKRTEPCLVMMRRTVSGAHVASIARLIYPGTRYSFAGQFQA